MQREVSNQSLINPDLPSYKDLADEMKYLKNMFFGSINPVDTIADVELVEQEFSSRSHLSLKNGFLFIREKIIDMLGIRWQVAVTDDHQLGCD